MPSAPLELPQSYRVFQRDANDTATLPFDSAEPAYARVLRGRRVVADWRERERGVEGIPVGGPYTLEVRDSEGKTRRATNLLVGDLWLLAGQSNMEGCGKLTELEPPSRMVHSYRFDESWDVARDPLHVLLDSIDPVHWRCAEHELETAREHERKFREIGGGCGVTFGKALYRATSVPVGLIPCAHGGTSMAQWEPGRAAEGGQSLYGSMLRRVRTAGGRVTGVLWYQGESDANDPEAARAYEDTFERFIAVLRKDLGDDALPFLLAQLSRFFADPATAYPEGWDIVRQAQLDIAERGHNVALVSTMDAKLCDIIHIDTASQRQLGRRFAELAETLAYGKEAPLAIAPGAVRAIDDKRTQISVRFMRVRERLFPLKRVWGFSVEDASGEPVAICGARTEDTFVILELERPVEPGAALWHGRGLNPTTILHDVDFCAPAFGPLPIE